MKAQRRLAGHWDELTREIRASGIWPLIVASVDDLTGTPNEADELALAAYCELTQRLGVPRAAEKISGAHMAISTGTAGERWSALQQFANEQEAFLRSGLSAAGFQVQSAAGLGAMLGVAHSTGLLPLTPEHRGALAAIERQVEEEAGAVEVGRRRFRRERLEELQLEFIRSTEGSDGPYDSLCRSMMVLRISRNAAAHARIAQALQGRVDLRTAFRDQVALVCLVALRLYERGVPHPVPRLQPAARRAAGRPSPLGMAAVLLAALVVFLLLGWWLTSGRPGKVNAAIEQDRSIGGCAAAHDRFLLDRAAGLIRPFTLTYRRGMPFSPPERAEGVHEERLLELIRDGALGDVVVLGGAGIGKSTFARKVVYGQLCQAMPAFYLELGSVYPADPVREPGGNALLITIARSLGLGGPEGEADLEEGLREKPFTVVLDGLDEVVVARRPAFIADVKALQQRFPGRMHLVSFGRRPLLEDYDYGLRVDNILEIPPLTCEETRQDLQVRMTDEERGRFWKFLADNGLEVTEPEPRGCHYTFIHNFRDMVVLTGMFRGTDRIGSLVGAPREDVLRTYVEMRLIEDSPDLEGRQLERLLDLVRAQMVPGTAAHGGNPLTFDASTCRDQDPRLSCLLESDLFKPAGASGAYRLKHSSLEAFVAALILEEQVQGATVDCDELSAQLGSSQDLRTFVGATTAAARCPELFVEDPEEG